jgi:hypothetical protein
MLARAFSHNPGTVGRLKMLTQFDIRPEPGSNEWFRLRSPTLGDKQLFQMLQAIWPTIVGAEPQKFALIYCRAGQNAGVWFHLLPNLEYEPGCHELDTF